MHPLILTSGMDGGSDAWWLSYGLMGRQTVLLNLIMTFQEGDQEFQILRKGYARRRNRCSVGKVKCSYLWPVIQVNMWPNHCWDHYSRISRHRYLFISLFILSLEVEWCLWLLQLTISASSLQVFYSKVTTYLLTPSFLWHGWLWCALVPSRLGAPGRLIPASHQLPRERWQLKRESKSLPSCAPANRLKV